MTSSAQTNPSLSRAAGGRTGAAVAAAAVMAVALALRFVALGHEGLWCDEAYTAQLAARPLGDMLTTLIRFDDAPPLFYLLVKLQLALTGNSEAAVRLIPALAGAGAVGILLVRWMRSARRADFWAAAFLGAAVYGVFYARQARSYTLVMLLALCVILCSQALLRRRSPRAGPGLAVLGTLLCLTHHLGAVLLFVSLILWPLRRGRDLSLPRWLLWHALPLAIWAAWLVFSASQLRVHAELNSWMGAYWEGRSLLLAPLLSLGIFVPGVLPPSELAVTFPVLREASPLWPILSGIAAVICLGALGLRGRRGSASESEDGKGVWVEAAFALLPLLALTVASLLTTPVYVLGRTDAIAYPAFALLIGRGLARLPRAGAVVAWLFWTVLTLAVLAPSYGARDAQRAKGADRQLALDLRTEGLTAGDWLVHTYLTAPSLEYYLERLGTEHGVAYFPEDAGRNPAAVQTAALDSLPVYMRQAFTLRSYLERRLPERHSLWVLALLGPQARPDLLRAVPPPGTMVTSSDLAYPMNLLVYAFRGTEPVPGVRFYRQDWVGGNRVAVRIPRKKWVPLRDLPPVQPAAGAEGRAR